MLASPNILWVEFVSQGQTVNFNCNVWEGIFRGNHRTWIKNRTCTELSKKKTKFFCKSSNQTISIKKKNNNNFLALLWDIVGQNIPVRSDYLRTGIISQFTVSLIYDLRSDNKLAHGNAQHTKQTGLNVFIRKIGKSSFSYLYMCSCDTWWSAHLRGQCRAASQRNTVWDLGQLLVFLLHSYVILIVTLNKQFIPCTITIPIYASNIRKLQKQVRTKVSGLME